MTEEVNLLDQEKAQLRATIENIDVQCASLQKRAEELRVLQTHKRLMLRKVEAPEIDAIEEEAEETPTT